MSQSAQRDPKLTLHSSRPAHTGLFAIRGTGSERYNAVDPALIAYNDFTVRRSQVWAGADVNFETCNRCDLLAPDGITIGYLAEHCRGDNGLLGRLVKGRRRPFTATIWDHAFKAQIQVRRPFYIFLSDMFFATAEGGRLGSVHRKFSLFAVVYEVKDTKGRLFAVLTRPFFASAYEVRDGHGNAVGKVCRSEDAAALTISTGNIKLNDLQRATLTAATVTLATICLPALTHVPENV